MRASDAVQTSDLTHRYGERTALDRVSLAVQSGHTFALLGPNGGGKTTLFRILSTLMVPSTGSAAVFGLDVVREQAAVRRRIGVVFQSASLDGKLTVTENLTHSGHLYGLRGRELRRRIDEVLSLVGVSDRASSRVEALSGGLARRVELAKALLHRPQLLLLDEPTSGLDVGARRDLWAHLQELRAQNGITVVLTTHILDDAEAADRVAILDAGKLVAVDTPQSLKSRVGGECVTVQCEDAAGLIEEVRRRFNTEATLIDGTVRIEHADGYRFAAELAAAFGERVRSITVSRPSLAEAFIHLTGHRLRDDSGA